MKKDAVPHNVTANLPFPERFLPQVPQVAGKQQSRRGDSEGARVYPSGRVEMNAAGSALIAEQVRKKFNSVGECGVFWAADTNTGEVAGAIVGPDVVGVTPIRQNKKKMITLYLQGVFANNPKMRPTSREWVSMTSHSVPEKGDYFVIHLNLALVRRKGKSSKSTDSAKQGTQDGAKQETTQAAQAKQSTPA